MRVIHPNLRVPIIGLQKLTADSGTSIWGSTYLAMTLSLGLWG